MYVYNNICMYGSPLTKVCIGRHNCYDIVSYIMIIRVVIYRSGKKHHALDCVLLSLYQLQAFYANEIKRGLAGLGEYTIAQQYTSLKLDEPTIECLPAYSPNEIVRMIREGGIHESEEHSIIAKVNLQVTNNMPDIQRQRPCNHS